MNGSSKRKHTKFVRRAYCRGTAGVEAIIAIPTLIVILVSVFYVSRSLTKKHHAEDLARSCAWRYSANGCSKVPPGCETLSSADSEYKITISTANNDSKLIGRITSDGARIDADLETAYAAQQKNLSATVSGLVRKLFGDYVMSAMQTDAAGTVDYKVSRNGLMETLESLTVRYQLPCNLKEKTVKDAASDAWKAAKNLVKNAG